MPNYKNPFEPGGKFYNPRITDGSKVTVPRIMPRWAEQTKQQETTIGTKFYDIITGEFIEQVEDDITQIISIEKIKYLIYTTVYESISIFSKNKKGKSFTTYIINSSKNDTNFHVLGGLTTEELNVRAFLTLIKVNEGGIGDIAYNKWYTPDSIVIEQGCYDSFTNEAKQKGHPGNSSHGYSAAGAYQILLINWNDDTWAGGGAKIREKYGITDFTDISQDRFAIGILKDKLKILDLVKKGDFINAANKSKNEWEFLKKDKFTNDYILTQIKSFIIEELKNNSQLKISVEQGLNGF